MSYETWAYLFIMGLFFLILLSSECQNYRHSLLKNRVNDLEKRIKDLENK